MNDQTEAREMKYSLSKKLLDIMLENGFLEKEEYAQIDALNMKVFSPKFSEVYV